MNRADGGLPGNFVSGLPGNFVSGLLPLPEKGLVYLDTNVLIYTVESVAPYVDLLLPLWDTVEPGFTIVTGAISYLETRVKPLKDKDAALADLYHDLLTADTVELLPTDFAVWQKATDLRLLGLKIPDAIHAATALLAGCALFLTNDAIFSRVPNLPVVRLDAL